MANGAGGAGHGDGPSNPKETIALIGCGIIIVVVMIGFVVLVNYWR